jgi:RNA recognition motif-containing protein
MEHRHLIRCADYGSSGGGDSNRSRHDHDDGGDSGSSSGRSDHYNRSSGGDDSAMETQRDTILIQNVSGNVTEDQLDEVFKQIAMIKVRDEVFLPLVDGSAPLD